MVYYPPASHNVCFLVEVIHCLQVVRSCHVWVGCLYPQNILSPACMNAVWRDGKGTCLDLPRPLASLKCLLRLASHGYKLLLWCIIKAACLVHNNAGMNSKVYKFPWMNTIHPYCASGFWSLRRFLGRCERMLRNYTIGMH